MSDPVILFFVVDEVSLDVGRPEAIAAQGKYLKQLLGDGLFWVVGLALESGQLHDLQHSFRQADEFFKGQKGPWFSGLRRVVHDTGIRKASWAGLLSRNVIRDRFGDALVPFSSSKNPQVANAAFPGMGYIRPDQSDAVLTTLQNGSPFRLREIELLANPGPSQLRLGLLVEEQRRNIYMRLSVTTTYIESARFEELYLHLRSEGVTGGYPATPLASLSPVPLVEDTGLNVGVPGRAWIAAAEEKIHEERAEDPDKWRPTPFDGHTVLYAGNAASIAWDVTRPHPHTGWPPKRSAVGRVVFYLNEQRHQLSMARVEILKKAEQLVHGMYDAADTFQPVRREALSSSIPEAYMWAMEAQQRQREDRAGATAGGPPTQSTHPWEVWLTNSVGPIQRQPGYGREYDQTWGRFMDKAEAVRWLQDKLPDSGYTHASLKHRESETVDWYFISPFTGRVIPLGVPTGVAQNMPDPRRAGTQQAQRAPGRRQFESYPEESAPRIHADLHAHSEEAPDETASGPPTVAGQADAPRYGPATGEAACGNCQHFENGWCHRFHFAANPDYWCAAWAPLED